MDSNTVDPQAPKWPQSPSAVVVIIINIIITIVIIVDVPEPRGGRVVSCVSLAFPSILAAFPRLTSTMETWRIYGASQEGAFGPQHPLRTPSGTPKHNDG